MTLAAVTVAARDTALDALRWAAAVGVPAEGGISRWLLRPTRVQADPEAERIA